jgi:predicted nucleic-acid-binding Zn-ribbon protein
MDLAEKLTANFSCAKCRGKSAITRTVTLSGGLPGILKLSPDRYLLLTCGLCGYTELYNLAAYALSQEPETDRAKAVGQET